MKVTVMFGLMWTESRLRRRHPGRNVPHKGNQKTPFFVGWSEARSPTAVVNYAPIVPHSNLQKNFTVL